MNLSLFDILRQYVSCCERSYHIASGGLSLISIPWIYHNSRPMILHHIFYMFSLALERERDFIFLPLAFSITLIEMYIWAAKAVKFLNTENYLRFSASSLHCTDQRQQKCLWNLQKQQTDNATAQNSLENSYHPSITSILLIIFEVNT